MSYICRKALSLGGVTYQPGYAITDGAVLPSRVRSQTDEPAAEAPAPTGETSGGVLYVPIKGDDDLTVPIPVDGAAFIFALQQSTADEAAAMLQDVEDENVLILIHATDSRKSVRAAAKARAAALHPSADANGGSEASHPPDKA